MNFGTYSTKITPQRKNHLNFHNAPSEQITFFDFLQLFNIDIQVSIVDFIYCTSFTITFD